MKTITAFCVLLLCSTLVFAQTGSSRIKIYNARIKLCEHKALLKGVFYSFSDSTIIIAHAISKKDLISHQFRREEIAVNNIKWIKIRRKGAVSTSAFLGAVIGGTAGAIMGYSSGDDEPSMLFSYSAEEKATMAGIPLFIIGGSLGAVVGSKRVRINIDQDPENVIRNYAKLLKYSIKKPTSNMPAHQK